MFKVKIADHIFALHNKYPYIEGLYRDYLTNTDADFDIYITDEDIAFEKQVSVEGAPEAQEYLESLAFYRKICECLLDADILLFHCSAIAFEGKGYLFTAPSGTGKSTHTHLWEKRFQNRVVMVNDDKPLISFEKSEVIVHGTPYGGKKNLHTNISVPIGGIVVLHQAQENLIRPMSAREAFPKLLNQTYRRKEPDAIIKTMDLIKRLSEMPVYSLGCTISQDAVTLAHKALTGTIRK